MKSNDFLINYFKSYNPLDFYIYNAFFFKLKKLNINCVEELKDKLSFFEKNLNKNDIHLLTNYTMDYDNLNFITKAKFILSKLFFSSVFEKIILEEIWNLEAYNPDLENDTKYDNLKYYFPMNPYSFTAYYRLKPRVYYFIRRQLILCDNKNEMIKKLKFDEQFKCFVIDRFYEEEKEITNKKIFEILVYQVCSELVNLLSIDLSSQKKEYEKILEVNETQVNRKLGL